jgi:hypothetical protein
MMRDAAALRALALGWAPADEAPALGSQGGGGGRAGGRVCVWGEGCKRRPSNGNGNANASLSSSLRCFCILHGIGHWTRGAGARARARGTGHGRGHISRTRATSHEPRGFQPPRQELDTEQGNPGIGNPRGSEFRGAHPHALIIHQCTAFCTWLLGSELFYHMPNKKWAVE